MPASQTLYQPSYRALGGVFERKGPRERRCPHGRPTEGADSRARRATAGGPRRLEALEARIEQAEAKTAQARREWATLVRQVGIAAVARRLRVARQTLTERVRTIEARNK
jgi:hypothetical protein